MAEKLDRVDDMERLLRQVIELKPDHHHAYNALGYSLADRNLRLPEASDLIQQGAELSHPAIRSSPTAWAGSSTAWATATEALRLLRQAYKARPDTEIAAHLGEVLWITGQRDEAQARLGRRRAARQRQRGAARNARAACASSREVARGAAGRAARSPLRGSPPARTPGAAATRRRARRVAGAAARVRVEARPAALGRRRLRTARHAAGRRARSLDAARQPVAQARWSPGEVVLATPNDETALSGSRRADRARCSASACRWPALFDWLHGRPWPGAPSAPRADPTRASSSSAGASTCAQFDRRPIEAHARAGAAGHGARARLER